MKRTVFDDEHLMYRDTVRRFIDAEIAPNHERWETDGAVDRDLFRRAAEQGLLGLQVPEEFGGPGIDDFRFNQIINEEVGYAAVIGSGTGLTLHNDVALPYFLDLCNDEQRARWLPGIADGTLIAALALTEPGMGSDLASMSTSAAKTDHGYVVNGSKTFITNGINADLVVTAVKTDPSQKHRGISLVVLERGMDGFERGRNLEKLGMHAQDTAELFFRDVEVPAENLLGEEGRGFTYMTANLAQERIGIALAAIGVARGALDRTLEYVRERQAFGQSIGQFQASRFTLAELATDVELGTVFCDRAVLALNDGDLTPEDAAMAKWWCTEMQGRVVDRCLQLHGGYGYMLEYPIARWYADSRISRIYGGTTEIMKEIIGRSVVGR
ncbi:acyl-CoA dehydrogenase family protein [Patulibacter minatonensis]|uniref:acyl-CoA dehydrogenase family protein n=1 Tax=Patulibacter minatonensis TaxID=298163 RepID=UPI00047AE9FC|nr:acyl-CoA dehydrogenase family protein [Patulibacter minatonensis]